MLRNQHCRTMSLLIGIFLMTTMMSKYNVAAYTFDELDSAEESGHLSYQRLRQLTRMMRYEKDGELFFEARAEPIGDCTSEIIEGYRYSGAQSSGFYGIETAQRCMDKCDVRSNCMGWSYEVDTKLCWFHSTITGITPAGNVKSGSCIGTSIKAKCTEQRDGQYLGRFDPALNNVASVDDCKAQCDQSPTCLGWLYDKNGQICYRSSSVGRFTESSGFITGSCLAPQERHRVADPIKIFRAEALDRHNEKRKLHCSPDLSLDDDLNKLAQDRANDMASVDATPPDTQSTKLQNVYYKTADDAMNGAIPVDCFYDENKAYNWDSPDFSKTNHFPKVIWKSSTKMGVGRAYGSDKITMYVVTVYDSEGDIASSYRDNVPRKCS